MPQKISKNISVGSFSDQNVIDSVSNLPPGQARFNAELNDFLDPFGSILSRTTSIAVAVSGGGDSMALCILLSEWAKDKQQKIVALTVDHGLRKNSAEEARKVSNWLAASELSIRHYCGKAKSQQLAFKL